MLNRDQVTDVEQAGEQAQQVTGEMARRKLEAAAHQQGCTDCGESERESLDPRWPAACQPQSPGGEAEARNIAEQGRVAELGHVDADVPSGEIRSEEEGGGGDERGQLA